MMSYVKASLKTPLTKPTLVRRVIKRCPLKSKESFTSPIFRSPSPVIGWPEVASARPQTEWPFHVIGWPEPESDRPVSSAKQPRPESPTWIRPRKRSTCWCTTWDSLTWVWPWPLLSNINGLLIFSGTEPETAVVQLPSIQQEKLNPIFS